MLHELTDYEKLQPLLKRLNHHLVLESMVAGITHGGVYVDDLNQPGAALCRFKDRFYLAGKPDSDFAKNLKTLFKDVIYPQAVAEKRAACVLYFDSENWRDTVDELADGKRSQAGPRRYFRRKASSSPFLLPKTISIQPIDAYLLARTHLQNIGLLVEEIQSERENVDDFLKRSFGVCALVGDSIAALCTSEFNFGAHCEVGIMTMEAYQRQGIATALIHALTAEAASRGITDIGWHCWARNEASVATALKAGFEPALNYPAQIIWYADTKA